jgi:hypothetical protein
VSRDSVVSTRLFLWFNACAAWGFEDPEPPFDEEGLAMNGPGEVSFQAFRTAEIDGETVLVSLTVAEAWVHGGDPDGDYRLDAEGCHVPRLSWHVQLGDGTGDLGAERLDVGPEDDLHPRIHRHPFREPNDVREAAELPPPDAWLHQVNDAMGGILDDGLKDWDDLADEEE